MSEVPRRLKTALSDRYAIEREIGAGGMATVYLAKDLRHNRRVAVKVLRPELAAVLGTERFLSEIQVTANLQHPHLLPLFDSGEAEGLLFYVMPYVEGESLRHRLERERQLAVEEAVRICAAVASALDYAHRHGVVHRDLKPENILLHEGQPLIADFGIALAVSVAGGARVTQTGLSLGTPAYMSPEQATGDRTVDARSDQYALAALSYEMLVGEPPHAAPTVQGIIAKLLTERPRSVRVTRPSVPEHVDLALQKALERLPADRFAGAGEFAEAITGVRAVRSSAASSANQGSSTRDRILRSALPWGAAAAAILFASATLWAARDSDEDSAVVRFNVTTPPGYVVPAADLDASGLPLVVSPDGRTVVYEALDATGFQLFKRSVDRLESEPIPGTAGGRNPFFSPDGSWIGFVAGSELKKVPLDGGPGGTIAEVGPFFSGATWTSDDLIVFSGGAPLVLNVVPASGGAPRPLTAIGPGETQHRWPTAIVGRAGVLFTVVSASGRSAAVADASGAYHTVIDDAAAVGYVPSGKLLFDRDGSLWMVGFDAGRQTVSGAPLPLTGKLGRVTDGIPLTGGIAAARPMVAVSPTGTLVHLDTAGALAPQRTLVWVDRQGREEAIAAPPRTYTYPRLSPDGRRVALDIRDQDNDIWILDLARTTLTRFTFGAGPDISPAWAADGKRIAYASVSDSLYELRWKATDGTGSDELLTSGGRTTKLAFSFTPSGGGLVIGDAVNDIQGLSAIALDGQHAESPLLHGSAPFRNGEVSPNGNWLAYESEESGRAEIFVGPLSKPEQGRLLISSDGGRRPLWSPDGRELFFVSQGQLMSVPVTAGTTFAAGTPEPLPIRGPYYGFSPRAVVGRTYDISSDGKRFLLIKEGAGSGDALRSQLTVVVNWFEELNRLVNSGPGAGR